MENGFQVTILDSKAPESWSFDWILVWPSILTYVVFSSIGQVSKKLGHYKRPKLDNIHYNRLIRRYNFIFCDSVSSLMCVMVNQIFCKYMKGKSNISWRDTWVTPSDTCDIAFLAYFQKNAVCAILVEQGQMDTFHRVKLQYWNSCGLYCTLYPDLSLKTDILNF